MSYCGSKPVEMTTWKVIVDHQLNIGKKGIMIFLKYLQGI